MSARPFRFGHLAMGRVRSTSDLLESAGSARDHGCTTFQVSDHFDRSPVSPLVALAAVAVAVPDVGLGTLVLANDFRHPAVLAKELATLDLLSDGRLEVGLGAGWMSEDYAVSGIARERAGVRIDRLAETVAILDAVLRADGPVTRTGEHYSVTGLSSVPTPAHRPRPPLLIGGGGPRILTLAARHADVVSINLSVGEGRVGTEASRSSVAAATDEKVGWVRAAAATRSSQPELHVLAYWSQITDDPLTEAEARITALGLDLSPSEMLESPHCLIGPLEQLVERVHRLRERWGISYVTFYDHDTAPMAPLISRLAGS